MEAEAEAEAEAETEAQVLSRPTPIYIEMYYVLAPTPGATFGILFSASLNFLGLNLFGFRPRSRRGGSEK